MLVLIVPFVVCSSIFQQDGHRFETFEANSFRSYASNLGVTSLEGALNCHRLSNLYGLEGDQLSAVIAWAIECYENGIISKKETDGLLVTFQKCTLLQIKSALLKD